jgi:hypothetical protein
VTGRHLTTAVTLAVLCVILVIALVVGFNAMFAPLPTDEEPGATASPSCTEAPVKKGQRLTIRQVTVNVYNGGTRQGLAGQTMDALRGRGFRGGEIGNAPSGTKVRRVQVWIAPDEEDAGRLVARQFGKRTPVEVREDDLANGVDVVVGNTYRSLKKAPRSVLVRQAPDDGCP